jgi:site-specific DNA recombinase
LRFRAGTVLVRNWGGVTHQAQVLEDGNLFRGKRYKSLSAVARVITVRAGRDHCSSASNPLMSKIMERAKASRRRGAIYTRKSSEEGLEQTSIRCKHSARRAKRSSRARLAKAGVGSRRRTTTAACRGVLWNDQHCSVCLLTAIRGRNDVVVVYKFDRLTRSLADFAKMVEVFDAHGVSFAAVTQEFNSTTSMGRLTLNVLLSFAQFEREVTGERIRDKIAASKRKGMWMGGVVPLS